MRKAWLAAVAAVAVLAVATTGLVAQDRVTAQRIGNTIYYSGTIDGEYVSGSTQVIGDQSYSNLQVGDRSLGGSSQQIGSFEYGNWSNGIRSTTHSIGDFDYTMSMAGENVTDAAAENVTLGRGDEPQVVGSSWGSGSPWRACQSSVC